MSSSAQVLPLTPAPNQTLQAPLNIDGGTTPLNLVLHYNEIAAYWIMSIFDTAGNLILDSVPLVAGNAPAGNILGQFAYLGIGSFYLLNVSGDNSIQVPDNTNLGTLFLLVWDNTPSA